MKQNNMLAMILAGGRGSRLHELTNKVAKPAVSYGGKYRIVDFPLSNCANSGVDIVGVLTQYESVLLNSYVAAGGRWGLDARESGVFVLPPREKADADLDVYRGTADAISQNIDFIDKYSPEYLLVLSGDHIYKMDVSQMLDFHKSNNSDLTISAIPIPIEEASEFGIIEVDENWRLTNFVEKPKSKPKSIPGNPNMCLASMGNYIFDKEVLLRALDEDFNVESSSHDFGKNVIPMLLAENKRIFVYNFASNTFPGMTDAERGYWRDVGSIDAYWQANMDLLDSAPELNLYSREWPLRTFNYNYPPAKFVWSEGDRVGMATNSMVSEGCIVSGGGLSRCVLSPRVRVNSYSQISESILMENVDIGRYSRIKRAIIDKNVDIPPNTRIGFNREEDERRGFYVSPGGVTVVPKGAIL